MGRRSIFIGNPMPLTWPVASNRSSTSATAVSKRHARSARSAERPYAPPTVRPYPVPWRLSASKRIPPLPSTRPVCLALNQYRTNRRRRIWAGVESGEMSTLSIYPAGEIEEPGTRGPAHVFVVSDTPIRLVGAAGSPSWLGSLEDRCGRAAAAAGTCADVPEASTWPGASAESPYRGASAGVPRPSP